MSLQIDTLIVRCLDIKDKNATFNICYLTNLIIRPDDQEDFLELFDKPFERGIDTNTAGAVVTDEMREKYLEDEEILFNIPDITVHEDSYGNPLTCCKVSKVFKWFKDKLDKGDLNEVYKVKYDVYRKLFKLLKKCTLREAEDIYVVLVCN